MTSALLESAVSKRANLSSMKWIIGGGERTPEQRIRDFSSVFPNARYVDAYGLTESGSGDTFMEAGKELEKIGSTGRATPHVEIKIKDEKGKTLTSGQVGEICLRGPKIFKGYWRDKEKTEEAFDNGWFSTGDVGFLDDEHFLYITDRLKDMIISGGENIASLEVERVIQMLPAVVEVAVVGVPDDKWGEVPVAAVVCKPGEKLDLKTLRHFCSQKLASFKVPKKIIIYDELPRNPSGKLLKRIIRENVQF
jgi:fatty-acyl-CoA synthase